MSVDRYVIVVLLVIYEKLECNANDKMREINDYFLNQPGWSPIVSFFTEAKQVAQIC